MSKIVVVDGGWGGHTLAPTSLLLSRLSKVWHDASALLSADDRNLTEAAVHLSEEIAGWRQPDTTVVLATIDGGQYAPSGAVAVAQDLGVSILSLGSRYVDKLLSRIGEAAVFREFTVGALSDGITLAGQQAPVRSLSNGSSAATAQLLDQLATGVAA